MMVCFSTDFFGLLPLGPTLVLDVLARVEAMRQFDKGGCKLLEDIVRKTSQFSVGIAIVIPAVTWATSKVR